MKNKIASFALFFLLTITSAFATPQRIISLAPDITENLFAIGAGSQVVGVIAGSDYPKAALQLPIVGRFPLLDLEKIIALRPDLIIVEGNYFARALAALPKPHAPIVTINPQHLKDLVPLLLQLGHLTGHADAASAVTNNLSQTLQSLKLKAIQSKKHPTVFYQLGDYTLFTINKNSWINDVIEICGGRNIFSDAALHQTAFAVSLENILLAKPDIVIHDTTQVQGGSTLLELHAARTFQIPPALLERVTPRLVLGAATICRILQQD